MPKHRYDAFVDTRYGGALARFLLDGIDKHPTPFQRFATHVPQYIAYGLDRLGYADNHYKRAVYTDATDAYTSTETYAMNARETRNRFYNSGYPNRKVRALRRTKRYGRVSSAVRASWRTRKNLPLTIAHEENTEVRSKPNTQAIVQFQAERRLPLEQIPVSGWPAPVANGSLNPGVNRTSDNSLGIYNIGESGTGLLFNQHMKYVTKTDEARTATVMNHRTDWTMFTNASWRDGYSALNGRFTTAATAFAGYITPVAKAVPDTTWFLKYNSDVRNATDPGVPLTPLQCIDYHHLYEELSVTITNNATCAATVTLYECVLNHDIPFASTGGITVGDTFTTQWGALPCPVELWRASRKINNGPAGTGGIMPLEGGVGIVQTSATGGFNPIEDDDGEGATGTVMGVDLEARPAGYTGGALLAADGASVAPPATTKDIDAHGVRVGGQLLHHWYTVKPHKRLLQPGQTTTISIKVVYNKRIPGTWWESLIGKAGYSRTFFMVNRPQTGVGSTGIDAAGNGSPGSRFPAGGPTDLVLKWTKRKSFTRQDTMPRRTITYAATLPYADSVIFREPDGDVDYTEVMDRDGQLGGGMPGAGAGS